MISYEEVMMIVFGVVALVVGGTILYARSKQVICSIGFMIFTFAGCASELPSDERKEVVSSQFRYDWCYDEVVCKQATW